MSRNTNPQLSDGPRIPTATVSPVIDGWHQFQIARRDAALMGDAGYIENSRPLDPWQAKKMVERRLNEGDPIAALQFAEDNVLVAQRSGDLTCRIEALALLGQCYALLQDHETALVHFDSALSLLPTRGTHYENERIEILAERIECLCIVKSTDDAMVAFRELQADYQKLVSPKADAGKALRSAAETLGSLLTLAADNIEISDDEEKTLVVAKLYAQASELLRLALKEAEPGSLTQANVSLLLGNVLEAVGQPEKAVDIWLEAAHVYPPREGAVLRVQNELKISAGRVLISSEEDESFAKGERVLRSVHQSLSAPRNWFVWSDSLLGDATGLLLQAAMRRDDLSEAFEYYKEIESMVNAGRARPSLQLAVIDFLTSCELPEDAAISKHKLLATAVELVKMEFGTESSQVDIWRSRQSEELALSGKLKDQAKLLREWLALSGTPEAKINVLIDIARNYADRGFWPLVRLNIEEAWRQGAKLKPDERTVLVALLIDAADHLRLYVEAGQGSSLDSVEKLLKRALKEAQKFPNAPLLEARTRSELARFYLSRDERESDAEAQLRCIAPLLRLAFGPKELGQEHMALSLAFFDLHVARGETKPARAEVKKALGYISTYPEQFGAYGTTVLLNDIYLDVVEAVSEPDYEAKFAALSRLDAVIENDEEPLNFEEYLLQMRLLLVTGRDVAEDIGDNFRAERYSELLEALDPEAASDDE